MGLFGDIWKGVSGIPRGVGRILTGDVKGGLASFGDTARLAAPIAGFTGVGAPVALLLGAGGGALTKLDEGAKFEDMVKGGLIGGATGLAGAALGAGAGSIGAGAGGAGHATRAGVELANAGSQVGSRLAGVGKILGGAGQYAAKNPELVAAGLSTAADVYGAGQQGKAMDRNYEFQVAQAQREQEELARRRAERDRDRRMQEIGMLMQGITSMRPRY